LKPGFLPPSPLLTEKKDWITGMHLRGLLFPETLLTDCKDPSPHLHWRDFLPDIGRVIANCKPQICGIQRSRRQGYSIQIFLTFSRSCHRQIT
jgi:hypothetical protein